jgi:hypothetical protein
VALPDLPGASPSSATSPSTPRSSSSSSSSSSPPASSSAAADAGTTGADASLLGQTRDRPAAAGPAFAARTEALWDAIVSDDAERAMPFFFPLAAYAQVKDVTDPASDWRHRLVMAYKRDIHALHARLADPQGAAKFVGLAVPEAQAGWVEPGEEWNKIGYYRVFGSKLRYTLDDQEHSFDVKSLISWRGEWFVVHLSAIK